MSLQKERASAIRYQAGVLLQGSLVNLLVSRRKRTKVGRKVPSDVSYFSVKLLSLC